MTGEQAAALLRSEAEIFMRLEALGIPLDLDVDQAGASLRARAELWLLVEEEATARRAEEAEKAKEEATTAGASAETGRRPRRARVLSVGGSPEGGGG